MRRRRAPFKASDLTDHTRGVLQKGIRRALGSPWRCLYGIDNMCVVAFAIGREDNARVQLYFPLIQGETWSDWTLGQPAVMAKLLRRFSEVAASNAQAIEDALREAGREPVWSVNNAGRSTLRLARCKAARASEPGVIDALFGNDKPEAGRPSPRSRSGRGRKAGKKGRP
jgi:hypothetical protein